MIAVFFIQNKTSFMKIFRTKSLFVVTYVQRKNEFLHIYILSQYREKEKQRIGNSLLLFKPTLSNELVKWNYYKNGLANHRKKPYNKERITRKNKKWDNYSE